MATKFISRIFAFLNKYFFNIPVDYINRLFDLNLQKFKVAYKDHVDNVLPEEPIQSIVENTHRDLKTYYYDHKKERRNVFVFYILQTPTFLSAYFWLSNQEGDFVLEQISLISFAIFMTWVTVHMLSIYRRRVYKKAKQIMAFERRFSYLDNSFTISMRVQYNSKELKNSYVSTTSLYRVTVVVVLIAYLFLLARLIW